MKGLREEITQIPEKARIALDKNKGIKLPTSVSYVGMGSSYFAPLTLYYCGADVDPQVASEYYYYLADTRKAQHGALISQSGESSETVWCIEKFDSITAITDQQESILATADNLQNVVSLHSGEERYSSTKSYVNTLVSLYCGLGIDPTEAVKSLPDKFSQFDRSTKADAGRIAQYLRKNPAEGLYVLGSGPNIGTAYQGALTLSETTKLSWIGMPVAQYDHGPKETADNSVVVILNAGGKDAKRIESLKRALANSNALVVELAAPGVKEALTPLPLITGLNLLMDHLADALGVGDTFQMGGKVTRVDDSTK